MLLSSPASLSAALSRRIRFLVNFDDVEGVLIFAAGGYMAAAEITLSAHCHLSGANLVFLIPVPFQVIVVINVIKEVIIEVTVNFLFDLARLNFKEKLRKFVHLSHHEVRVELLKLLTGELEVKGTLLDLC